MHLHLAMLHTGPKRYLKMDEKREAEVLQARVEALLGELDVLAAACLRACLGHFQLPDTRQLLLMQCCAGDACCRHQVCCAHWLRLCTCDIGKMRAESETSALCTCATSVRVCR